jgi:hypothetical protein
LPRHSPALCACLTSSRSAARHHRQPARSCRRNALVQHYDTDVLDAAMLLVPLTNVSAAVNLDAQLG